MGKGIRIAINAGWLNSHSLKARSKNNPFISSVLGLWPQDAIGEEFQTIMDQEPDERISPYQQGPASPQGGHEPSIHGDQSLQQLRTANRQQQDPRRANGPERAVGAREEDRQMACYGEFQLHQSLELCAVKSKNTDSEIEQAKS